MSVAPKKRHRRSQQAIQRTLGFVSHVYSFARIDAVALAARHADVIFIGAAVALNSVLEVANALFNVFTADFAKCVHMSTVTGLGAAVVAHETGYALCIVVFVQSVQFGHFI